MDKTKLKFSEFKYERPNVDKIIKGIEKVVSQINNAKSVEEVKLAFENYHKISLEFYNATSIS